MRWTAPAPISNDGSGNHMPLRTKKPMVRSMPGANGPLPAGSDAPSRARQYAPLLSIVVVA